MQLQLNKKPQNCTLIIGFPGFGLVGTIATEFLIEHLQTVKIGKVTTEDVAAIVAIHESKIVEPIGIFYNKKWNIAILHVVNAVANIEWKLAEVIDDLVKKLKVKEIVSLEGVGSQIPTETSRVFYFLTSTKNEKKIKSLAIEPLKEGIIMGVTGAILLRMEHFPTTCFFAETHTQMPDSKAAAKIIETMDKYMGLAVDYKPLLKQAEKFEEKLKDLMKQSQQSQDMQDKKKLSYVG